MKAVVGVALIIAGILLGAYLGLWVMLAGGVIQIVHSFQAEPVNALGVAVGVLRILCSAFVGWGTIAITGFIGTFLVTTR